MKSYIGLFRCGICQQDFHSEKGLHRHIVSRKHQKRQNNYDRYIAWRKSITSMNLPPLPNTVIQALIDDLNLCGDLQKDDFFTNINLVDVNEFNRSINYNIQHWRNWNNQQHLQLIPFNGNNSCGTRFSSHYPINWKVQYNQASLGSHHSFNNSFTRHSYHNFNFS